MDEEMTEDELVAALFAAQEAGDLPKGALTTRALSKMVRRRREWVRERLRTLLNEGLVERVTIQIVDISGRATSVPAYRLKDDKSSGTDI